SWGYALFRHFHKYSSGVMVPTHGVLRMLEQRGFRQLRSWTHGVDTALFPFHPEARLYPRMGTLVRPVSLFVGRVSYEKNIEAFLTLDIPGTKVVCGVGPLEASLKERYPQVRWLGVLPRDELARVYAAADVFVFPSRSETFGLVMLEAMASGTPVAAYPVDGPLEVLGKPDGSRHGGVLDEDLKRACYSAMAVPRHEARARSLDFSWAHAAQLFEGYLVPVSGQVTSPLVTAQAAA
ncbi:MAG: glycosyltransferase, partial [Polaromonas sp.]|nr:glycosyltransferase [Polaromonas sp.]